MSTKRNIGRLAAIGGFSATIALLTGLPVASADELSDLRANQELMQRRIDQLAAQQQAQLPETRIAPGIAGPLGTQPIPGQAIIGGSFPRSFLIPGTDTSIRVGGFIDYTGLYFFQGANSNNPGNPTSNFGQNGNLNAVPVGQQFVPGVGSVAQGVNHSRGNGVYTGSPQQSRFNVETRTPTAWGEARTFFEWDWSGCNNFSCQTLQQAGGDSIVPRLRFAYGTLGGFLAGQAISNFSDADADTESLEFGGAMGSTGGYRVPQVRYTLAGPWGSAWSVSAEQPHTDVFTPAGILSSDSNVGGLPGGPGAPTPVPPFCNGVACTGAGGPIFGNLPRSIAPNLTAASYWAQPWGHVDFAAILTPLDVNDGAYLHRQFVGYGGHIAGDVKPGWFGWEKDDFQFSYIAGQAIGNYMSGGWSNAAALATNFTLQTQCPTPRPGCTGGLAASNVLVNTVFGWSTNGGYEHWWLPNLRSQIAAGYAEQDIPGPLVGTGQEASATHAQWNAFANLIWNPVAFITTGIQYNYGKRITVAGGKGNAQAVNFKWRVAF